MPNIGSPNYIPKPRKKENPWHTLLLTTDSFLPVSQDCDVSLPHYIRSYSSSDHHFHTTEHRALWSEIEALHKDFDNRDVSIPLKAPMSADDQHGVMSWLSKMQEEDASEEEKGILHHLLYVGKLALLFEIMVNAKLKNGEISKAMAKRDVASARRLVEHINVEHKTPLAGY